MPLPYIPDTITVHLGPPDADAPNVTVPFASYVKNVASSEIFPTWPEAAIRANMLAQISFALNRVYTEWYRSQGYDFDITNSTAFDQAFVAGRDIFENISEIADELFTSYLTRPGSVEPLFAQYCDGVQTTCEGLSQWGTVPLAEQGLGAYDILTQFYGPNLHLVRNAPVSPNLGTYPGTPLRLGDINDNVRTLQLRLNRISTNYPLIPKIYPPDGVFDLSTEEAVRTFQRTFGLTDDGIVGQATWYRIAYLYTAIKRLAELDSEGILLEDVTPYFELTFHLGDTGIYVRAIQYYLQVLRLFYPEIPEVQSDGYFGPETEQAIIAAQNLLGLPPDGAITPQTGEALTEAYINLLKENPNITLPSGAPVFPGRILVEGMRGPDVLQAQTFLNALSQVYPEIPAVPLTGYFGEITVRATLAMQEVLSVPSLAPGTIGPVVWSVLADEYENYRQGAQAQNQQYPGYVMEAAETPAETPAAE